MAPPARGRGNVWAGGNPISKAPSARGRGNVWAGRNPPVPQMSQAERNFQEAKKKNEENVKRALENNYETSSDEDELDTNQDNSDKSSVLSSVLKAYANLGGSVSHIGRTEHDIESQLQSGAITCLICISSVKRPEQIWTCQKCFCIFHLQCMRLWVRDSVSLKRIKEPGKHNVNWNCPNCRSEYEPSEAPERYFCFCGKTENPQVHPWLIPHSCGETCEKPLQPFCGHYCLLLCHPGPCPPCPKTVTSKCYCKNSSKQQRCGAQEWSCGTICKRPLLCKKHNCTQVCHKGDCAACPKQSSQKCFCGSSTQTRPCASPQWQCTKVCGKPLDCGNHVCETVCHSGPCKPCPINGVRTCSCGKTTYDLPCNVPVPNCGDTCDKLLECGSHRCIQRCHNGKCGLCLERIVKACRCGRNSKEVPCAKPFLCETKCKKTKDCLNHPCNRKCCDGNCPPCEKKCDKTLSCHNHKCGSMCHQGPCFPCMLKVPITCKCGGTKIEVPCGTKKRIKPPTCNKLCKLPSACHHPHREERHKCHFGFCPPCEQKCNLRLKCGHHCQARCHSAVVVDVTPKNSTLKGVVNKAQKKLPCPECKEPVIISCLGGHEQMTVPCKEAKPTACGNACGAPLECTNHFCNKLCHDRKMEKCESCDRQCEKPTLEGCTHPCLMTCHPGKCKPCTMLLKKRCHCNVMQKYINCVDWCSSDAEQKIKLQSCGGPCPKTLLCGHPCTKLCHPGECPNADPCRKKTKISCSCNRIKVSVSCDQVRAGKIVECDDVCKKQKEAEIQRKKSEEAEREKIQKQKEQEEFEAYQKKMSRGPRRRNDHRRREGKESHSMDRYKLIILGFAGLLLSALLTYYFMS
ncbi:unnamed protein product [Bemisia tabaci]|uniref:NF-X1-type zinc finger protein NFXL1 n=1 Tax=Bemisia tabaci TaxID=7038 RepID=A0A9P0A5A1_BEMTA|nr:unnamed protein product [Bemisia tabaci]